MSYEPLHHKYRPQSFAELVGQEAIATTLTNAINSAKIAPAYLFTGPRGTGKTSSARILAKSLNCLKSDQPTASPCGLCDVCRGITKGATLDVVEIDAASNTGVDNIREIIERAQFAPVQCRYKVYAIDECHMLSNAAFNSLLKTLEEPPKHVVFVLATTDPQRVLPTIISRCQRFDFRRIGLEAMVKHLTSIAQTENININPEAVTLIAQLSQGGLRDAQSLLDQLSLLAGEVTAERVWDLVGAVSERDLLTLVSAIASDQAQAALETTRQILDRGREPLTVLQNLAGFYRDLLIAKTAPNRNDLVPCTQQTWQELCQLAQSLNTSNILAGQQHLRTSEVQLKNSTQPRLWLEVTLLGLLPSAISPQPPATSYQPPAVSSQQPPATNHQQSAAHQPLPTNYQPPAAHQPPPTNYQPPTSPSQTPPTVHQPPTPPAQPAAPISEVVPTQNVTPDAVPASPTPDMSLAEIWQQVLVHFEPISSRELLRQMCQILHFDGTTASLGAKPAWQKRVQTELPKITAAFQTHFQRQVTVKLEILTSPSSTTAKTPFTSRQQPPQPPQPAPSYTNQVAPAPQPLPQQPPKAEPQPTPQTLQTTPLPEPSTPTNNWQLDEVAAAAQRLAQFFDGEIVKDTETYADTVTSTEWDDIEIMNDE